MEPQKAQSYYQQSSSAIGGQSHFTRKFIQTNIAPEESMFVFVSNITVIITGVQQKQLSTQQRYRAKIKTLLNLSV